MNVRKFLQNKLWRDKAVDLMEQMGSKINWVALDDKKYDEQLRLKILEEAQEVAVATSRAELVAELADVLEVIDALCLVNKITTDEIYAIKEKKRAERGGFEGRRFVTIAEHPAGGFGEKYCLADPEKYPEIID